MTLVTVDQIGTAPKGKSTDARYAWIRQAAALHPVVWLYLMTVILPVFFQLGPLTMNLQRLVLIVLVLPLLAMIFSGKYGKVMIIDVLFVLFIMWAAIAMTVINPDRVIQYTGASGVEFLGGYAVGRAFVRTPEAFGALCKALGMIILASLPFAIYELNTGRPIIIQQIQNLPGFRSVGDVNNPQRLGFERVQLTFAHPIHYGLFCSIAFSMAFVGLKGWTSDIQRFLTSAVILFCGASALSSGALLALVLQVGLIVWAFVFRKLPWRWWLLIGLGALAYVVVDVLSNRKPLHVFLSYATFSSHTAYWRMIIFEWGLANVIGSAEKGIVGSPWFGIGLNDWVRPWYMRSGSMDNFWLVVAVLYGLPALFLLGAGYLTGVIRIVRRDFEGDPILSQLRLAWVFTFIGLTFTLCTVHIWNSLYSFVFFFFGAGMWLIYVEKSQGADAAAAEGGPNAGAPTARRGKQFTRFPEGTPSARTAPQQRAKSYARKSAATRASVQRQGGTAPYTRFPRDGET